MFFSIKISRIFLLSQIKQLISKYKGKVKLSELLSIAKLQKSSYEYAVKAKERKKPEKCSVPLILDLL